jgi:protease-4
MPSARPTLVSLAFLSVLAASPRVFAQANLYVDRPLSAGVLVPPTNTATVQSPFALVVNPAGLVLGPGGLVYVHEDGQVQLPAPRRGDGLYLSLGGLEEGDTVSGSLGLGFEWIRPRNTCNAANPCLSRISLGLAVGTPLIALGGTYHWFSSAESSSVDKLGTFDLGLTIRPAKFVSLAGTIQALNQPRDVPRNFFLGLAVRPVGGSENLTLGADYDWDTNAGFDHGRFNYYAAVRFLGLELRGNLAHPVQAQHGVQPIAVEFALRFGFGHLGLWGGGGGVVHDGSAAR